MSELEQRVRREAHLYWQEIQPDPAFVERLIQAVDSDAKNQAPYRWKFWGRVAATGVAASVLAAVSIPSVRAAAANAIRKVFQIDSTEYVVHSGPDPAWVVEEPETDDLDPHPNNSSLWFYTQSGELPAEAAAALEAMSQAEDVEGDVFRLPAWLPEDAPKRLQLPPESDWYGILWYSLAVIQNGKSIMVTAKAPMVTHYEFVGTTQRDAQAVPLGNVEGLALQEGSRITYYLTIDNVTYRVSGPETERETIKRIAESLSAQES